MDLKAARLKAQEKLIEISESRKQIKQKNEQESKKSKPQKRTKQRSNIEDEILSMEKTSTRRTIVPVSRYIKQVLDYLKEVRKEIPIDSLFQEAKIQLDRQTKQKDLLEKLKTNPKIEYNPEGAGGRGTFAYKATHSVSDIAGVIDLLASKEYVDGIDSTALEDAYNTIKDDIETLKQNGRIFVVFNQETKSNMLYYNDPQYNITVDKRIKEMWHEMKSKMPDAQGLEKEIEKAGYIKPVKMDELPNLKRQQEEVSEKKRKQRKLTRITNEHVPEFAMTWTNEE